MRDASRIELLEQGRFGRDFRDTEPHRLARPLLRAEHRLRGVVQHETLGRHKAEAELGMEEMPAAHETVGRVLAVCHAVETRQIGWLVTMRSTGGWELAGAVRGILDPFRRRWMGGQKI